MDMALIDADMRHIDDADLRKVAGHVFVKKILIGQRKVYQRHGFHDVLESIDAVNEMLDEEIKRLATKVMGGDVRAAVPHGD